MVDRIDSDTKFIDNISHIEPKSEALPLPSSDLQTNKSVNYWLWSKMTHILPALGRFASWFLLSRKHIEQYSHEPEVMAGIRAKYMGALSASQVSQLSLSKLTESQLQALKAHQLQALSREQLRTLNPKQFKAFHLDQINALSNEQFGHLDKEQFLTLYASHAGSSRDEVLKSRALIMKKLESISHEGIFGTPIAYQPTREMELDLAEELKMPRLIVKNAKGIHEYPASGQKVEKMLGLTRHLNINRDASLRIGNALTGGLLDTVHERLSRQFGTEGPLQVYRGLPKDSEVHCVDKGGTIEVSLVELMKVRDPARFIEIPVRAIATFTFSREELETGRFERSKVEFHLGVGGGI